MNPKILLIAVIFIALHGASSSHAEEKTNYFEIIESEDVSQILNKLKVSSCDEFSEQYLEAVKKEASSLAIKALAYDIGLCVPQNLKQAAALYKESHSLSPAFPNLPLRLALIYSYGPSELRNISTANFLYKQTALNLIVIKEPALKQKIVNKHLNHQPMPPELETQMAWAEDVFKKPAGERESIARQLENEGFENTSLIWPLPDDFRPLEIQKN